MLCVTSPDLRRVDVDDLTDMQRSYLLEMLREGGSVVSIVLICT